MVEKKEEIWLKSYDKSPYTHIIIQITTCQHKNGPKTKQLLHSDLRQSVGVPTVTQLVWLNRLMTMGSQPSHAGIHCNSSVNKPTPSNILVKISKLPLDFVSRCKIKFWPPYWIPTRGQYSMDFSLNCDPP